MTTKSLNVLHVVRQFSPSTGGLEVYVNELARRQSKEHAVSVLTLNHVFGNRTRLPKFEQTGGFAVHRVPFVGFRRLFLPYVDPRFIRRFDVVHIHAADQLLDLISAISLGTRPRLFMTTHGLFFHTEAYAAIKRLYLRTITQWSLRQQQAIFAVSNNDKEVLNGVGINAVLLRNPIIPLGHFICDGPDLLYVGRLSPNKRLDKLITFMEHLEDFPTSIKLHIVGSDGEGLWQSYADLIRQKSLEGRVIYHGYLDQEALINLARNCGFIVSASRYEGFGLSIVEGMSLGLLPCMHANAAFQEIHALSGCGLVTNFDEPAEAARAFATWLPRVDRAQRSKAARFAHKQSWDTVCGVYEDHYRRSQQAGILDAVAN